MTDNTEVHPLVTLLLERMKSHPEEFEDDYATDVEFGGDDTTSMRGRWQYAIQEIYNHGSDKDEDAFREGMRIIRLDKAHKWALDELLNGEERRAQERREREEAAKMRMQTMMQSYQAAQRMQNAAAAQLQGIAVSGGGGGGGGGIGHPLSTGGTAATPTGNYTTAVPTGNYTTAVVPTNSLKIGNETIDESFLSTVRKKLGI